MTGVREPTDSTLKDEAMPSHHPYPSRPFCYSHFDFLRPRHGPIGHAIRRP